MSKIRCIFCFVFLLTFFTQRGVSQSKGADKKLIDSLISKKRIFNKEFGYGYRIQFYNGPEEKAKKIQTKIRMMYPKIKTYITYRQPEWKIQVGFYKTQLEADRAIIRFKERYSGAIVVPLGR